MRQNKNQIKNKSLRQSVGSSNIWNEKKLSSTWNPKQKSARAGQLQTFNMNTCQI